MTVFTKNSHTTKVSGDKDEPPKQWSNNEGGHIGDGNAVHKEDLVAGDSLYARLQRFAGQFGVEERGIERVPHDERTDSDLTKIGTLVSWG